MNKQSLVQKSIRLLLFLGILCALFLTVQNVLKKDTEHRGSDVVKGFYAEKKNDMDVVFLGSSTMFCTVDPLVLYENYGIAAYDFGCSAQAFESEYLYLKEVLRYQKPKVIGLEVVSIKKKTDPADLEVWSYAMADLRFSFDKMTELYRMLHTERDIYAMQMLPILQYKDRWKELSEEDFADNRVNYTKGAYTPAKITEEPLDFSRYYTDEPEGPIPEENRETLEKIVTLCRENGISLFLFKGPNIGWTVHDTENVQELADQYDLPFLNYFDLLEELNVDPVGDFRDFSHFNRFGSQKASVYMGQYLKEQYDLPDRRAQEGENSWDISLQARARDRAQEALRGAQGLDAYLNLIPYTGHTVVFSFHGDTRRLQFYKEYLSTVLRVPVEEMTGNFSIVEINGLCDEGVIDGSDKTVRKKTGRGLLGRGELEVSADGFWWNGENGVLAEDGITIWVYDDEWEQLVDHVGFAADAVDTAVRPAED